MKLVALVASPSYRSAWCGQARAMGRVDRTRATPVMSTPPPAIALLPLGVLLLFCPESWGQNQRQTPSIVVLYSQNRPNGVPATSSKHSQASRNPKLDAVNIATGHTPALPAPGPPRPGPPAPGDVLLRGRSPKPKCAGDQPFCLYDQEYPLERVHEILNTYHEDANSIYHQLQRYSPQEFIARDNVTHNYRHRGNFVCESEVAYLRPGWARNWKDQWVAVVNTDKFPQMVRVETCKFAGQRCEYLPPCYRSSCVQRFAATRLMCVDPANPHQRPVIDVFEMPVACSCFVDNFRFI